MSDKTFSRKSKGSATLWAITAVAALAIIGLSVYVAIGRQPQPSPPVRQTRPQPEAVPESPGPKAQPEQPSQQQQRPATRPQPAPETPREAPPPAEKAETGPATLQLDNLAGTLSVSLPFMKVRNKIPLENTCYRTNQSPEIRWSGAPPSTESLVVFLERRTGDNAPFENWLLFDIPAGTGGLDAAQPRSSILPNGAKHAMSDFRNIGYIGPCEPKGQYTYAIRVFALDTMLDLPAGVGKDDLIRAMNGHIIDAAEQEFIHYKLL